ncbi:MAG: hypothetical protein WAX04_01580, partial [Oscillospiraceae bacterium]
MNNILMLTTYPLRLSIHGGQRRSTALKIAYEKAGYRVVNSAIYNAPSYPNKNEKGELDLPSPAETLKRIKDHPLLEDLILGKSCADDPLTRRHVLGLIKQFKPAYIVIEQPYLYMGLKRLFKEENISIEVINSSHNVEYKMKKDIYAQHSDVMDSATIKQALEEIKSIEEDIAQNAKFTIAVSESDALAYKEMGAKKVIVVPNGINQDTPTKKSIDRWNKLFTKQGINKPILFTGSAHPPNWKGFMDIVGSRVGFLPMNSRIMIVGDVGP